MATDENGIERGYSYASPTPGVPLVKQGSGWRVAFAQGFLDGDSNRSAADTTWGYIVGWKVGNVFRRLKG